MKRFTSRSTSDVTDYRATGGVTGHQLKRVHSKMSPVITSLTPKPRILVRSAKVPLCWAGKHINCTNRHPHERIYILLKHHVIRTLESQQRCVYSPAAVMECSCLVHNCTKMDAQKVMLLARNMTTGTLDFSLHSAAIVI